jgi:hypothetical protein
MALVSYLSPRIRWGTRQFPSYPRVWCAIRSSCLANQRKLFIVKGGDPRRLL